MCEWTSAQSAQAGFLGQYEWMQVSSAPFHVLQTFAWELENVE